MVLVDGLGGEELGQAGSQKSSTWLTGSIISESIISGAHVYATGSVSASKIESAGNVVSNSKELSAAGTGSPTSWGQLIQGGSDVLTAGSNKWIVFGTAFSSPPVVVTTNLTTANTSLYVPAGSISAGSCYTEGPTAGDEFSWMALGN